MEDDTASECIRTVAATYGCKILQLYEYDASVLTCTNTMRTCTDRMRTCTDTIRTANDTPKIPYQFMHHKTAIPSAMPDSEKIRPLIGRRIRIGRQLDVNQR